MLKTSIVDYHEYINGQRGGERQSVFDPAIGQHWATIADGSVDDVGHAVDAAFAHMRPFGRKRRRRHVVGFSCGRRHRTARG